MTRMFSRSSRATFACMVLFMALLSSLWFSTEPTSAREIEGAHGDDTIGDLIGTAQSAPIVANGTVAGAKTDFVISLDIDMNPKVAGWTLLEGNSIRVTLPDDFVNSGEPALAGVTSSPDCVPANMLCTTSVMLSGWPQRPIPPPTYELSFDGNNTLVITALKDLIANPPAAPGIKQIHLLFQSFTNPEPGLYWVNIEAEVNPDGSVQTGIVPVEISAEAGPRIAITSIFNPGSPNTIYQDAPISSLTPLPYDFLIWGSDSTPMVDVSIEQLGKNLWVMTQDARTVGIVEVQAPSGATGQNVYTEEASTEINAPISKAPTGRLRAFFQIGSEAGEYIATFHMLGGNSVQMVVNGTTTLVESFTRLSVEQADPNGNTMLANCGGDSYEDATATIAIDQVYRNSAVHISLQNAKPDTFYTLWLRLRGDTEGKGSFTYGGSPITDAGSTPLAPSTELVNLIAASKKGAGNTDVANGFMTDGNGNGKTVIALDFPMLGGAYPFQKADPTLGPVAIVGAPFAPFMVRLVSHCTDNVGHGVNADAREPWFDWSPQK